MNNYFCSRKLKIMALNKHEKDKGHCKYIEFRMCGSRNYPRFSPMGKSASLTHKLAKKHKMDAQQKGKGVQWDAQVHKRTF